MPQRTHHRDIERQRARRRIFQGVAQAAFYAGTAALTGGLIRALLHLLHLSGTSC